VIEAKKRQNLTPLLWVPLQSTLMRSIASGKLDGFPPKEVLRTVYVEHDIDASQAETSVVDFVVNDKMLDGERAVGCRKPCWCPILNSRNDREGGHASLHC